MPRVFECCLQPKILCHRSYSPFRSSSQAPAIPMKPRARHCARHIRHAHDDEVLAPSRQQTWAPPVADPARPTASESVLDVRKTVCNPLGLVIRGLGGGFRRGLLNRAPLPCPPIRTDNDLEQAEPFVRLFACAFVRQRLNPRPPPWLVS